MKQPTDETSPPAPAPGSGREWIDALVDAVSYVWVRLALLLAMAGFLLDPEGILCPIGLLVFLMAYLVRFFRGEGRWCADAGGSCWGAIGGGCCGSMGRRTCSWWARKDKGKGWA